MPSSIRSTRALLAAFAALSGFLSFSNAQSVATTPVGAVTTTVPVGLSTLGITLLNPDLVVSNCTANTTSVLTLSGVSNVGSLLTTGTPYYVEAISGPMEGERFDVDTDATITSANGTVTLAATNNTTTLTASEAVASQFALRKHITLAQVQSMFTAPLVSNTNSNNADQIRIYNPTNGTFTNYFLRTQTTWAVGSANSNNVVIPPGVGVFFSKKTSPGTLVFTGGVRVNDFSMPMDVGLSLRCPAYPVAFSPAMLGATVANGWTGGSTQANADQIRIYSTTNGTFTISFMRTTSAWVQGSATVTTTPIIGFDGAYMLSRKVADTDYILTSPIAL